MILSLTRLKVSDNSGVKYVKCFKIVKNYVGSIGSIIHVSIKSNKNKSKLQKGNIAKGIVIRSKKFINRLTGDYLNFDSNDVVLLNDKYEILGTRVFGPLPSELRKKGHLKLLSLGSSLV